MKHKSLSEYRYRVRGRFFDYPARYIEDVDPVVVFEHQRGMCAWCYDPMPFGYELDHIIPIALGGTHCYSNVQALHPECHHIKTQKDFALIQRRRRDDLIIAPVIRRATRDITMTWLELELSSEDELRRKLRRGRNWQAA